MIVSGTHTIKETKKLDVDIDIKKLLESIWWQATTKPKGAEYIHDGYWYVHDFYDYHKGYDKEKKDRAVTEAEQIMYNAYLTMQEMVNET